MYRPVAAPEVDVFVPPAHDRHCLQPDGGRYRGHVKKNWLLFRPIDDVCGGGSRVRNAGWSRSGRGRKVWRLVVQNGPSGGYTHGLTGCQEEGFGGGASV